MKTDKELKKELAGAINYQCDGNAFMCRWNDNRIVTNLSNMHKQNSVKPTVQCYKGGPRDVNQPHMIDL